MTDATAGTFRPEATSGPMVAADGTPLKKSLARALRRQKLRALMLVAPLLIFILISFIFPIGDMLFRSVKNEIVQNTIPRTVQALNTYDGEGLPPDPVFDAFTRDMMVATEKKLHTRLGSRLNYEASGISSLFRKTGRGVDDIGEEVTEAFFALDPAWEEPETLARLMGSATWLEASAAWLEAKEGLPPRFEPAPLAAETLPRTTEAYRAFADTIRSEDSDSALDEDPWNIVYLSLAEDLKAAPGLESTDPALTAAVAAVSGFPEISTREALIDIDEDWGDPEVWRTIQTFSPQYTNGYFLAASDLKKTPDGITAVPEDEAIYVKLFIRTMILSLTITGTCILLGYPIAWLLANLPMRTANLLMILVLLPFWTSLLVRTSAWKVLLQQQGVINDILVWVGIVSDTGRLVMINNQTGTVIAMTHILLPFMILPLYSVMKTIPPSYLRAAKSLGATNWTAFWRVYFPQSVPGIGAGSILVFILAIGYYITPELVGGTDGTFISNRIAYHISSSLNWGLAAALGTMLLVLVLALYWVYDRLVGIDNVKLG
ncbi:MAG: ABC transporter permease [Pseudomonadota bacterium]